MAEVDWTIFPSGLTQAAVDRGVSNGFTPPSGGGSWVYGWNTLQAVTGGVGKYLNQTNFIPMAKGGSVRGAIKRLSSTGATPMLHMSLQGSDVTYQGYLLGFAHDEEPSRLVVVKGAPQAGLSIEDAVVQSTSSRTTSDWAHLRLDIIRQPSDDVWIRVYENDLDSFSVTSPTWVLVAGMELTIDDALGINLGTQPFLGGYGGVAYYTEEQGRYGFVDHVEMYRQL